VVVDVNWKSLLYRDKTHFVGPNWKKEGKIGDDLINKCGVSKDSE
jgi:hypothetical protein